MSAGQLTGILRRLAAQPHPLQQRHGLSLGLLLEDLLFQHRRQRHIFQYRHVGEYVEVLEHHANALAVLGDIQLGGGHVLLLVKDLAAVRGLQQVQTPQKGGLSAAAGPNDRYHLALADGGGDPLQHLQLTEALFQVLCSQDHVSH